MPHPHHAERRRAIFARNIGFFFFSFVNTACITVFPQHFFAAPQYEARAAWLSLTLLAGALCSAAGVQVAARHGLGKRPVGMGMAAYVILALVALSVAAGAIVHPVLFVLSQCALCLGTGYLSQALDQRSVFDAGLHQRAHNDAMLTACRFLGMLGAPLVFGFALPGTALAAVLVAFSALTGFASTWQLAGLPLAGPASAASCEAPDETAAERALDRLAILIYAGYCVLAASAVLLLGELQGFADAVTRGPRLIAVVYAAAFVGTALIGVRGWKARIAWMLPAPAALLLVAICLSRDLGQTWNLQIAVCVVLGFAFACFLLGYRNYLSHGALAYDRPFLIAKYNRLAIVAALLAFAVMLASAAAAQLLQQDFGYIIVAVLAFGSLMAIPGLLKLARAPVIVSRRVL